MTDENWKQLENTFDWDLVQSTRTWYYNLPADFREDIGMREIERCLRIYEQALKDADASKA